MEETLLMTLLRKSESDTLDFKEKEYPFVGASDEEKSELLKDILAFANAWKETDAYILVGVKEKDCRADGLTGVSVHLADNDLQQFVNAKSNRPVAFSVEAINFNGVDLDVIRIDQSQNRPLFLKKSFGKLKQGEVYIRRGSSTAIADADEISEMGKTEASAAMLSVPSIQTEFADPFGRVRWGQEHECISTVLLDPPQRPKTAPKPSTNLGSLSLGEMARVSLTPVLSDPFAPKHEEWVQYLKDRAFFQPIGLWMKNTGVINATTISVEMRIPHVDGLQAVSGINGPEKPRPLVLVISRESAPSLSVKTEGNEYVVTIEISSLQPKAENWSDGVFYVGANKTVSCECQVRVFADNLPNPILASLQLSVKAERREYTSAELYKLMQDDRE